MKDNIQNKYFKGILHKRFIFNNSHMLLIIGILLIVLWLLGFTVFHVTAWFIHIVLIVAIVMILLSLLNK